MAKRTPALALAVWLASLGALHAQEMVKPLGKWERKIGKKQVALVVEDHRLHVTVVGEKPCTIHADYSVTKDQIIYGVVTSVECEEEDAHSVEKEMLDAPFSCRFRVDEGVLIVRDLKMAGGDTKDDLWVIRFKAVSPPPVRVVTPPSPATSSNSSSYPPSTSSSNNSAEPFQFWTSFGRY